MFMLNNTILEGVEPRLVVLSQMFHTSDDFNELTVTSSCCSLLHVHLAQLGLTFK